MSGYLGKKNLKNKPKVDYELRSAHGRAVKKWKFWRGGGLCKIPSVAGYGYFLEVHIISWLIYLITFLELSIQKHDKKFNFSSGPYSNSV